MSKNVSESPYATQALNCRETRRVAEADRMDVRTATDSARRTDMIDIHEVESRSRVNDADLRVRRTRKLLKDALTELWSEKSFDSITVQDIAERAMVNRATFYLHFQDKYTLFDQVGRDKFHQLVAKRLPEAASFNRNNLRSLVLTTMETLEGIS